MTDSLGRPRRCSDNPTCTRRALRRLAATPHAKRSRSSRSSDQKPVAPVSARPDLTRQLQGPIRFERGARGGGIFRNNHDWGFSGTRYSGFRMRVYGRDPSAHPSPAATGTARGRLALSRASGKPDWWYRIPLMVTETEIWSPNWKNTLRQVGFRVSSGHLALFPLSPSERCGIGSLLKRKKQREIRWSSEVLPSTGGPSPPPLTLTSA